MHYIIYITCEFEVSAQKHSGQVVMKGNGVRDKCHKDFQVDERCSQDSPLCSKCLLPNILVIF